MPAYLEETGQEILSSHGELFVVTLANWLSVSFCWTVT